MADAWFNEAKNAIFAQTLDLTAATIHLILVDSSYTFDADDDFVTASGVGTAELSGTGYTAGWGSASRKTLVSPTFAVDNTLDLSKFTADPVTFSSCGPAGTAAAAVLIREGGASDADSLLIAYFDTGYTGGIPTNGSDIVHTWPSNLVTTLA